MLFFLHRLLFLLPPEWAHSLAAWGLKLRQFFHYQIFKKEAPGPFHIQVSAVPQLLFRSRVGLAAGFDKNAELFPALIQLGFGFIEVGTVTPIAQVGNPKPRLWRCSQETLINQMGFNNCGLEAFRKNLERLGAWVPGVPILANIGKNKATSLEDAPKDYAKLFSGLAEVVDGFVVNVSSPNTPGLRDLQSESFLDEIARLVPPELPVLVKFAPDLPNEALESLADYVGKSSKFTGMVLTNTSRALAASQENRESGGLSGPPLFARALECVSLARPKLPEQKLLIGLGGIDSREKAEGMRDAGADLIEVYTGFVYRGPRLLRELHDLA